MELVAVGIFEKDKNADILLTWSYPSLPEGAETSISAKLGLSETVPTDFFFAKHKDLWVYAITTTTAPFAGLPRVAAFSIVLFTRTFNPEKFKDFGSKLASVYGASGNPPKVLQAYLSVMTRNAYDFGTLGQFATTDYDDGRAMTLGSVIDLVKIFGLETILIYNAILLKKRVVVFCSKLDELLKITRTLPALVFHRKNWSILRPYVRVSDDDLQDLAAAGVYVAGFTDRAAENREDLYDLFVDVDDQSVTVAPHAKNDFLMGKPHKELAQFLVSSIEDPANTEQQLIKSLSQRTKQLLVSLESLADETGHVTAESIKSKELPTAMARFMWNLAIAEERATL